MSIFNYFINRDTSKMLKSVGKEIQAPNKNRAANAEISLPLAAK